MYVALCRGGGGGTQLLFWVGMPGVEHRKGGLKNGFLFCGNKVRLRKRNF